MSYRNVTLSRNMRIIEGNYKLPDLELGIHSADSKRIIISYPGVGTEVDCDRYIEIGDDLQERRFAFVRAGNPQVVRKDIYKLFVSDNLAYIVRWCIENSEDICGRKDPKVGLMGVSGGASAIAAVAGEFPAIDKVLIINPSGDAQRKRIEKSLKGYTGELYVVLGEKDDVIPNRVGQHYHDLAEQAARKLVKIPHAEHLLDDEDLMRSIFWVFDDGNPPYTAD